MCWSEEVSWLSLVVGTIINCSIITYYNNRNITVLCIVLEYALLMQIFEAYAWRIKKQKRDIPNCVSYGACVANLTQVVFAAVLFLSLTTQTKMVKIIAWTILLMYISLVVYFISSEPYVVEIRGGDKKCNHLSYSWWDSNISTNADKIAIAYFISRFILVLLLVKPFSLAFIVAIYIGSAFLLSSLFYPCGTASVWCWFISFATLFFALCIKIFKIRL